MLYHLGHYRPNAQERDISIAWLRRRTLRSAIHAEGGRRKREGPDPGMFLGLIREKIVQYWYWAAIFMRKVVPARNFWEEGHESTFNPYNRNIPLHPKSQPACLVIILIQQHTRHILVGGLEHFLFFHIFPFSWEFQLTFIFFRGIIGIPPTSIHIGKRWPLWAMGTSCSLLSARFWGGGAQDLPRVGRWCFLVDECRPHKAVPQFLSYVGL